MSDISIHFSFNKESCNMVHGCMVIERGVQYGTLYKLLERTIIYKFVMFKV